MTELGNALLTLARNAIAAHFGLPPAPVAVDCPELAKMGATFVTLTQRGQSAGQPVVRVARAGPPWPEPPCWPTADLPPPSVRTSSMSGRSRFRPT